MNRVEPAYPSEAVRRAGARHANRGVQRGVTLIEALITLLVVSIGLLGIAALQVVGIQEGASAHRHSQATWLAYDMADRMRANINPASLDPDDVTAAPADIADHYDGISVSADTTATGQTCGAGNSCTRQQMADFDSDQWRQGIMDLPNGSGAVDEDAAVGGRYQIRVMWDEVTRAGAGSQVGGCPSDPRIASDPTIAPACVELWVQP